MGSTFDKYLKDSTKLLKDLYPIYRSNIKEIYNLKAQSKQCMNELSEIDSGLSAGLMKQQEKSLAKLIKSIEVYNKSIDKQVNSFYGTFNQLKANIEAVMRYYESDRGELTSLLKLRKQLLFLMVLFRKYKIGIQHLQLMNNALLSFSDEFGKVYAIYRSNLVKAATIILEAEEQVQWALDEMENIN